MTNDEARKPSDESPEPPVEGSSEPAPKWWHHPRTGLLAGVIGVATVLLTWFSLTFLMLRGTRDELKNDLSAAERRLNTSITRVEDRLGGQLSRLESRLDRLMESLLDEARQASAPADTRSSEKLEAGVEAVSN